MNIKSANRQLFIQSLACSLHLAVFWLIRPGNSAREMEKKALQSGSNL